MMQDKFQKFLFLCSKRNDILLVILLISVIFMIILPLPTMLVDSLIALNLAITALILMVAIYLTTPLNFSTFPSVLLITTLFRLALSITTTRLILLEADAGQIVYTFGNFVIGGNIVVGMVIFLIITIMQFIVITKGSERVAEVSARFSLDAMPGKQMSIDGDLRAGVIDMHEAKRRRSIVEKESQLYGSMDGAMKFVKGDSIAGLIIIAVNIIGGISIGVFQQGMNMSEALQIYAILTVGDGLIQQIPSLFIAITSGIIVTRVSGDSQANLGDEIINQLTIKSEVIIGAGIICFIFAIIPGMPTGIFLVFASLFGLFGYYKKRDINKPSYSQAINIDNLTDKNELSTSSDEFSITTPLMVDVDCNIKSLINPDILHNELIILRNSLYHDLGVPFPGIHLRFNDTLEANKYIIYMHEVPIATGYINPNYLFVMESTDNLKVFDIPSKLGDSFLPNLDTVWVSDKHKDMLDYAQISYMNPVKIIIYHIAFILRRYADDFIGIQEIRYFIENMESVAPEITKEIQRALPIQKITEIIKRLVSENVSIRNLKFIFSVLIDWSYKEKDIILLTEYVRGALKRQISYQYAGDNNILPVYILDNNVEDIIRNSIRHTAGGSYLALDQSVLHPLFENIKKYTTDINKQTNKPVMLTSVDVRRYVRKMIENDFYNLPVISYQELTQEIIVQPLAHININIGDDSE